MSEIRLLDAEETRARMGELADVLADCVTGGASVGFMAPYGPADALPFWRDVAAAVGEGATLLFAAERAGRIVGTVQVGIRQMPNQPHRADVKKLLVMESERGRGIARALMAAAEAEAARRGKTVLVLDTATGSPAETVYERLGWQRAGVIPDYALYPDGRFCATTFFYKRIGAAALAA
ncbi:GNAT family N-acetyltransferase [Shinella yambaruensis]|uniref:N-acetyltransferase n=1 Tax=Shinella yambaruensis TaxID=415996 RepID=A0ABQ5ZP18_9HYPH|nr:GNAT family N-acetyltransferase [Shinella yambaruensis]MCJ8029000.1 GNAT family N-acetyltransferase [Shinella yambaruensis]MCU7982440.1 GNAT family N-acetyltransferase [Shinella yambaruensis]GLR54613.1 N-acetyltransferase [Shinella yambaruensis]